jgi:mono/diheme cytochrome c family protein
MGFRRFVNIVEVVAGVAALVFVIALFANEPSGGGGNAAKSGPGYDVYVSNCARCHGQEGQGGVGPQLAGVVATAFPDAKGEIAVVRDGRDGMPSFAGDLSPAEIEDVVAYTRTELNK